MTDANIIPSFQEVIDLFDTNLMDSNLINASDAMTSGESSPVTAADSNNALPASYECPTAVPGRANFTPGRVALPLNANLHKRANVVTPNGGERRPRKRGGKGQGGGKDNSNSGNGGEAALSVQGSVGMQNPPVVIPNAQASVDNHDAMVVDVPDAQESAALYYPPGLDIPKAQESFATQCPSAVAFPTTPEGSQTNSLGRGPPANTPFPTGSGPLWNHAIHPYLIYTNTPFCSVLREAGGDLFQYILKMEARCGNYAVVTQDDITAHILNLPEQSYIQVSEIRAHLIRRKNDEIIARALKREHSDPEAILFNRLYLENESMKMFYQKTLRVGPRIDEVMQMDVTQRIIAYYPMILPEDIALIVQDQICDQYSKLNSKPCAVIEESAFGQRKKDTIARFTAYVQLIKLRVKTLDEAELDLMLEWDDQRVENGVCDAEETFYAVLLRRVALPPANPLGQSDFWELFWKGKVVREKRVDGFAKGSIAPGFGWVEGQLGHMAPAA
jgi:hypothetical protein